ncbi:hypothetical protein [Streptomyces bugieae]|nr:hypothetical protein [Streptomyces sp. DSM 41528]
MSLGEPSPGVRVHGVAQGERAARPHLARSAIAHFACHGTSDSTDPSQSRLILDDHATAPLTVSALGRVSLDHAQMA